MRFCFILHISLFLHLYKFLCIIPKKFLFIPYLIYPSNFNATILTLMIFFFANIFYFFSLRIFCICNLQRLFIAGNLETESPKGETEALCQPPMCPLAVIFRFIRLYLVEFGALGFSDFKRPESFSARRRRNSMWALRLRMSLSAHFFT